MAWVDALQKAIDYMEANIHENMSIEEIASQANVSAFHFQRTFSVLTEMSVGEYLRKRRLSLAAQELASSDLKIIDIAYKYGYDTPEAFSKAFRRQHQLSPMDARRHNGRLTSYNRLIIQVNLKGAKPMDYHIVEKEKFQVVGIKKEFSLECEENLTGIPVMWEKVNKEGTDQVLFQLNDETVKGILGVCVEKDLDAASSPKMDYWIAASSQAEPPEGMETLEIPAAKWAAFEVRGPMPGAIQETWKRIFSEWFPSSGYEHAEAPGMEVYTEGDPSSPDYESEIWIPIK
ncbi:AraC family transcriptional regulator [Thalassobacillus pellis]|uniref:AraC family transcriptional regulator n=1 Tax=Thalassobacillus pellis TaxID=748008 RepID=UPI00195FCC0D|nr:AraC family transcriptional regulator [Thalassobacillus pellis]MBM7551165.1 AraC family transcriptional regulator [Thalassobacillus pellis]